MEDINKVAATSTPAAGQQDAGPPPRSQHKPAANSLIQVIEKLSRIVEERPDKIVEERADKIVEERADKIVEERADKIVEERADKMSRCKKAKVDFACYQCSLCPYMSSTLALLKQHLKQHDKQHQDLILMCSECCFSSPDQAQLEEHIRMHLDPAHAKDSAAWEPVGPGGEEKKWYSYEDYGLYRCLICSYVCSQQRMLKTHAWKHAGLLHCSYPVFEEGAEPHTKSDTAAQKQVVLLSPLVQETVLHQLPPACTLQTSASLPVAGQQELLTPPGGTPDQHAVKVLTPDEPVMAVHLTTEAEADTSSVTDSLLSSAQKIINNDPNSAGHMNVIVERLPSAEDAIMAASPLLLAPHVEAPRPGEEEDHPGEEELGDHRPSLVPSSDPPRDENVPPAARKRTHSESLRLHSLAAEVLIAMPMRTAASTTAGASQKVQEMSAGGLQPSEETETMLDTDLTCNVKEAGLAEGDDDSPASKAGISLSLLTVIERLRERSDQNATDEDILKELQDNAQIHGGSVPDQLAAPADGGLVDYIPGSERPYRCRLCRYSSNNKGYIKQHLRVHRQRRPYQCPICEHVSSDSQDLQSHMMHHCKTRMYQCPHCPQAFHYKSQLRSHEREHHSECDTPTLTTPTLTTPTLRVVSERASVVEECEGEADQDASQKMYRCDKCDYTSATYLGVRNHRRIHNTDKPYRCCSCDFATSNMSHLKSHMKTHPAEQTLDQYRCSLCGYMCSHPPSLKSHMWKHAGDKNYNYEQVNKAINQAISQSSRAPVRVCTLPPPVQVCTMPPPVQAPIQVCTLQAPVNVCTLQAPVQVCTLQESSAKEPDHGDQGQVQPQPRPNMEYCVLLFCCCICGLESPSKESLLAHMKEHEGDLVNIILNKQQEA
ncbi:zinc finger protein 507 isoform X3 [Nerophis ophidion]|uniref:zinc finger protein 507 isoform X3 n=1 Tax=Nerophis ophidion TaxID=159077 RepID=UPI002AE0292B|nr:zinc finger protein 507 isoform X3 [Nerophis ophidion]